MRLLLTGSPGIGKTTVVRNTVRNLPGIRCAGFYTEEKRDGGVRRGFIILTLDGAEGILATVGGGEGPRVGRYTVHVQEFEGLVLPRIDPGRAPADLYVIDEIGKMELLSQRFRSVLVDLLAWPSNLLATIAQRGKGFMEQMKGRSDVELIEVTRGNRDRLPETLAERIVREIKPGLK